MFMSLQMRAGFLLVLLLSAAVISQSEGGWLKNVWGKVKQVRAQYLVSPFVCVSKTAERTEGGGANIVNAKFNTELI